MRADWVRDTLSLKNEIPRSAPLNKESTTAVDLHVFGDTSIAASCALVYGVVYQPSVTKQGSVVSKSCVSKKLVLADMASDLIENVKAALKRCNKDHSLDGQIIQ